MRIENDIWRTAGLLAHEQGSTLTRVIRDALLDYIKSTPAITKQLALERLTDQLARDGVDWPDGHPCRGCGELYKSHPTGECQHWY